METMEAMLRLRWLRHVSGMGTEHIPRQLLICNSKGGKRCVRHKVCLLSGSVVFARPTPLSATVFKSGPWTAVTSTTGWARGLMGVSVEERDNDGTYWQSSGQQRKV